MQSNKEETNHPGFTAWRRATFPKGEKLTKEELAPPPSKAKKPNPYTGGRFNINRVTLYPDAPPVAPPINVVNQAINVVNQVEQFLDTEPQEQAPVQVGLVGRDGAQGNLVIPPADLPTLRRGRWDHVGTDQIVPQPDLATVFYYHELNEGDNT